MSTPAIQGTPATTNITTNTDPWSVNLPGSIANGERLFVFLRAGGANTFNLPSGWNWLVQNNTSDASDDVTSIIWRNADGAEGATLSVDLTGAEKGSAHAYRVSGHDTGSNPIASTVAVGTDANPDPSSPTMPQADYLSFAYAAMDGETQTVSSYPSNYTTGQTTANSGTGGAAPTNVRTACAARTVSLASSEDPGSYTFSASPSNGWTAYAVAQAGPTFLVTQRAYRWYNNDGGDTTATEAAAENTRLILPVSGSDPIKHLRVGLQESGPGSVSGAGTDDWQLQYRLNGGSWNNMTTTSSVARAAASGLNDGGTVSVQRLSSGTGSFVNGEITEDGIVVDRQLTADNYTELVYSVQILDADVTADDDVEFQVLYNAASTRLTYSQIPHISIPQLVSPALLSTTPTLFAATLDEDTGQDVTVNALLTVTPTLFTPKFRTNVAPSLLTASPTLFSPRTRQLARPSLLTASPTLFAASLPTRLTAGLISATPTLFSPRVRTSIAAGMVTATPSMFAANLAKDTSHTAGLITATPTLFAVSVRNTVKHSLLTVTPALFAANVASDTSHTAGLITATPTLFQASVTVPVRPSVLATTPVLFAPSIATKLAGTLITASPTLFSPRVTVPVYPGLISASPTLFSSSVRTRLTAGLLTASPTLFAPSVTLPVRPSLLTASPTLFAPSLASRLAGSLLVASPAVLSPTLRSSLAAGLLTASPALFAAELDTSQQVQPALLTVTPVLFSPAVAGGPQTVEALVLLISPELLSPDQLIVGRAPARHTMGAWGGSGSRNSWPGGAHPETPESVYWPAGSGTRRHW